jgi:hypothetical protein
MEPAFFCFNQGSRNICVNLNQILSVETDANGRLEIYLADNVRYTVEGEDANKLLKQLGLG